jgi:chorismate-pyruvate lyase
MAPHVLKASDPFAALSSVVGDFFNGGVGGGAVVVDAGDVPVPFDRLLVHEAHMTTTLGAFYGESVVLRVLDERQAGDTYLRKIILTVGDAHVVEVGVVRIHLEYTSADVRSEILSKQTPLGDILIQHDVMRRIEPKWFFRFDGPAALLETFGRTIDGPVYGRVGVIHCDGQPAIELLEVVSGDRSEPSQ